MLPPSGTLVFQHHLIKIMFLMWHRRNLFLFLGVVYQWTVSWKVFKHSVIFHWQFITTCQNLIFSDEKRLCTSYKSRYNSYQGWEKQEIYFISTCSIMKKTKQNRTESCFHLKDRTAEFNLIWVKRRSHLFFPSALISWHQSQFSNTGSSAQDNDQFVLSAPPSTSFKTEFVHFSAALDSKWLHFKDSRCLCGCFCEYKNQILSSQQQHTLRTKHVIIATKWRLRLTTTQQLPPVL